MEKRSFTTKDTGIMMDIDGIEFKFDLFEKGKLGQLIQQVKIMQKNAQAVDTEDPNAMDQLAEVYKNSFDDIVGEGMGDKFFQQYNGNLNKMMQVMQILIDQVNEQKTGIAEEYLKKGETNEKT